MTRKKLREGDGVLSMEQVHEMIAHVPDRYKSAVWLLVFAGLRSAELCGLRVRDIDFVCHEFSVRASLMPVHRFGGEPYRGRVERPPQTDAGDRTIPIPGWALRGLGAAGRRARHNPPSRGMVEGEGYRTVGRGCRRGTFIRNVGHFFYQN